MTRTLRHAGNARPRAARARRCSRSCRARSRTPRRNAPAFARILADVDPAAVTSRAALARLPVTRKSELLELQKASRPFGGFAAARWGARRRARAGLRVARADLRAGRARAPTTGGSRARCSPPAFAAATSSTTVSRITSRRRARCSKPARTRWAARCSPAAPARPSSRCRRWRNLQPDGYVGTPSFLRIILEKADELGVRAAEPEEGAGVGRSVPAASCATRSPRAASPATRSMRARTSASIAYETAGARRASSSTKACWSRSCGPAPAIRWRRARSAKSS